MLEQKQDGGTASPGTCMAETSYRPLSVETVQGSGSSLRSDRNPSYDDNSIFSHN